MPVSKNKKTPARKASASVAGGKKKTTKKSASKKPIEKKVIKKITKKKAVKKTAPKKVEKKIEADLPAKQGKALQAGIKEAVDKLPGLIVEQVKFSEQEKETYTKKEFSHPTYYSNDEKKKRQLLWLTVIAFTAVILGMWGWNTVTMFTDTKNIQKNNQGILDQAKNNWENIQNTLDEEIDIKEDVETTTKEEPTKVDIKDSLKASLAELLNTINTTSTVTSTDITTSTTTTTN